MADIYGSHFEYASKSSRDFGIVIVSVDSERMIKRTGDIEGITFFNKTLDKRYLIDDNRENSPLTFDVDFVAVDQAPIDFFERRKIEKWLFNRHDYRKLYIDMADDPYCETYEVIDGVRKRNYLNCRFINAEKIEYNGGVVGYKATLEADSSMFWQDPIIKTYEIGNEEKSSLSYINISVDTDIDDYTYPKITINVGTKGGDIIIVNNSDNESRLTKFVNLPISATIVMNSGINYVSGQYYEKFYDRNFIRLVDGENNLSIKGNVASITVEYQNRRAF